MNKVFLIGRVGNVELVTDKSPVLKISLAVNEKFKDKSGAKQERVDWFRLVMFGDRATNISQYVEKGSLLSVVGKVRMNVFEKDGEKKYSTDIIVDEIEFLSSKGSGSSASDEPEERSDDNTPPTKSVNNSEIPF